MDKIQQEFEESQFVISKFSFTNGDSPPAGLLTEVLRTVLLADTLYDPPRLFPSFVCFISFDTQSLPGWLPPISSCFSTISL